MQPEESAYYDSTGPPVSNSTLTTYLDVFIVIVILVFALLNIPRALAYIANHRSRVFQGYLLRSSTQFRAPQTPNAGPHVKEKRPLEYSIPTLGSTQDRKEPWHFPMHLSWRHPAASFVHYRVLGNYTVIQVLLMAGYTAAVFYAAFDQSNPFTAPDRIGWVIASQFPFVYAFATKNNVIGLLVGVGYEKLNYLHRHIGRLLVIGANFHALDSIYEWSLAGTVSLNLAEPYVRWGIVTLVCFDLLGFFSLEFVRTKYYNLFFGTHVVGLFVALIAASHHQDVCIPFVIAAAVVYGLDHVVRAIKTRITTATLRTIPEMGLTRVDIPSLTTGWRPGQHVRLRVLSTAMGLWGVTEVHPFTISSATKTREGLVLMCKKTGGWTSRLYDLAQKTVSGEQGSGPGRMVRVMVEGPYGGIGDTTVPNYSGAMFIAGGSGVTFALSAAQDLVFAGDGSRTKVIDIVWCIASPAALEHFVALFAELVSQSGPAARVRVSVFYTRATTNSLEGFVLPPGITLSAGRPNIEELLDGLVARMRSEGGTHGAFVAVCGPGSLGKDVARAVRTHDTDSKKAVGGIEFHEEVFGW